MAHSVLPAADQSHIRELFHAVLWQLAVVVVVVLIATVGWGLNAGLSAFIGGAAYLVPNALFAFRIALTLLKTATQNVSVNKSSGIVASDSVEQVPVQLSGASPAVFFLGELFKIASCVGILFLTAFLWPGVIWLAMLIGLFAALKAYLFALFFSR